jgi:murein endopeptidase
MQLPRHRGYRLIDSSRAWGTSGTIGSLVEAFDDLIAIDPASPRVEVHDLSLRSGGPMRGHKSHQTGRDVDITYYQRPSRGVCLGRRIGPDELDSPREWRLLRHWLERGQAEFIFIDYGLQQPLYEAAKASGATERQLAEWFQYPRDASVRAGIIRHVPNHANHVHVRFRSDSSNRPRAETLFDDASERSLLDILEE